MSSTSSTRARRQAKRLLTYDGTEHWHGTTNGYVNHVCRCDLCREAYNAYNAEWRSRPAVAERRRELARIASRTPTRRLAVKARQYGVDRDTLGAHLEAGICFACDRQTDALAVDHDHACCPSSRKVCGACVRGLLCRECNQVLGLVQDDPERLTNLIAYLERWSARAPQ